MRLQKEYSSENMESKGQKGKHITESERYKIEGYKQIGMSHRKIAKVLEKSHSAINEEINEELNHYRLKPVGWGAAEAA